MYTKQGMRGYEGVLGVVEDLMKNDRKATFGCAF